MSYTPVKKEHLHKIFRSHTTSNETIQVVQLYIKQFLTVCHNNCPPLGLGLGQFSWGPIILESLHRNDAQTTPFSWLINVTGGIISLIVYLISLTAYLFVNTHPSEVGY